jgi:hypothetical protein
MDRVSVPDDENLAGTSLWRERSDDEVLTEISRIDAIDIAHALDPARRFGEQINDGTTAGFVSRRRLGFDESTNEHFDLVLMGVEQFVNLSSGAG